MTIFGAPASRWNTGAASSTGGSAAEIAALYAAIADLQDQIDTMGGGGGVRVETAFTTAILANDASEEGIVALGKTSLVVQLTATAKCRVRFYSTAAYRTADATREPGVDPQLEHGVMLDILFPDANLTWDLSPLAAISNDDDPVVTDIYYSVQNLSGAPAAIEVTIVNIPLEA